ncbi:MAG: amidohydrolase family protein [Bacteroidales bacterium]
MLRILYITALLILPAYWANSQNPSPAPKQKEKIVITGGTAHIGNGEVIQEATIEFENGKITKISNKDEITYDNEAHVIEAKGKHIYPGLILPDSQLGLVEIGSVRATNDTRETGELNPNVRSIVAYNTDSRLIPTIRSNGVLMAQIVPGGGIISGTSSIVQLDAWDWEQAAIKLDNGIHLNWPAKFKSKENGKRVEREEYKNTIKKIKKLFDDASAYGKSQKEHDTNPRLKSMQGLFDGSTKLYINTSSPEEIIESVSFAKEYDIENITITGVRESAWKVKDFIKEQNVSVILSEIHSLPSKSHADIWEPSKLPAKFYKEGIPVSLSISWLQGSMNYAFLAGTAAAYGLDKEEALELVTSIPADIIGIDDRAGTLETGKDASLIISEGDILDMKSNNITEAFIQGRQIDLDNKHKKLYRKYKERYGE